MVNRALRALGEQTDDAAENSNLPYPTVDLKPIYSEGKATEVLIVVGASLAIAACCISYFCFKKFPKCHQSYTDGK